MALNHKNLCNNILISEERCVNWLQEKGLIGRNPNCDVCGKVMNIRIRGKNSVQFVCKKRGRNENEHESYKNALTGTFFEKSKFGIVSIVSLMYFFSQNQTCYKFLMKECNDGVTATSSSTICDWLSYCREVCFVWLDDFFQHQELLGGPGVVVEIDECKIGKRKYNKGRMVEGSWILGMIEINTGLGDAGKQRRGGRFRIELCPGNRRDAETLIPLILKHVKPETTIVTDMWKSYFGLPDIGYTHFTVNHSTNFISPVTGANTQTIESNWRAVKKSLKTGLSSHNLAEHLAEFLYRREVEVSGVDEFCHFIDAVKAVYPPNN